MEASKCKVTNCIDPPSSKANLFILARISTTSHLYHSTSISPFLFITPHQIHYYSNNRNEISILRSNGERKSTYKRCKNGRKTNISQIPCFQSCFMIQWVEIMREFPQLRMKHVAVKVLNFRRALYNKDCDSNSDSAEHERKNIIITYNTQSKPKRKQTP